MPPCCDDPDPDDPETPADWIWVCPKKKPGHSDLTPKAADIFWFWRLCENLDDHPDDLWHKRYRRMLDRVVAEVKAEIAERRRAERQERRKRSS